MKRRYPLEMLALFVTLAAPASAQVTWIVDDDPGPGVNFTDLPPAVAAAAPFDTILVQPGTYSSTTVDEGLRIIGTGAVRVESPFRVRHLPASQIFVAAGLEIGGSFEWSASEFIIEACDGTVVVEDVVAKCIDVESSMDVRLQRVEALGTMIGTPNRFVSSRVELIDSVLRGAPGEEVSCNTAAGDHCLLVESSFVHVAASDLEAGEGGWCVEDVWGCCGGGGSGGTGLMATNSQIVMTGASGSGRVAGGGPGGMWAITGVGFPGTGDEGIGIDISGFASAMPSMRVSNFAITGDPARLVGPSVAVTNATGDPIMRVSGAAHAAAPLQLEIFGTPGEAAQLDFGRSPQVTALPGSPIEVLTSAQRRASIGMIPPSGRISLTINVPSNWPSGTLFFLQARTTDASSGTTRMSNSAPLIVR